MERSDRRRSRWGISRVEPRIQAEAPARLKEAKAKFKRELRAGESWTDTGGAIERLARLARMRVSRFLGGGTEAGTAWHGITGIPRL